MASLSLGWDMYVYLCEITGKSYTLLCYWCSYNACLLPLAQIISDPKQNKGYFISILNLNAEKTVLSRGIQIGKLKRN
jgi:hypothetical protein